jgi:hypothetical protein
MAFLPVLKSIDRELLYQITLTSIPINVTFISKIIYLSPIEINLDRYLCAIKVVYDQTNPS